MSVEKYLRVDYNSPYSPKPEFWEIGDDSNSDSYLVWYGMLVSSRVVSHYGDKHEYYVITEKKTKYIIPNWAPTIKRVTVSELLRARETIKSSIKATLCQ